MPDTSNDTKKRTPEELAKLLGLDIEGARASRGRAEAANDADYSGEEAREWLRVCTDGERTGHLVRLAGFLIGGGLGQRAAAELCAEWNARNAPPLEDEKVRAAVASIARTHARNHPDEAVDSAAPLFELRAASVARFFGREAPPRDWVLEDCLPAGKVGMMCGPGGTGKSQLALQLAFDVAIGTKCFSPWSPGPAGQVILLSAEDDEDELHRRFNRLMVAHARNPGAGVFTEPLARNLFLQPRVSENNLLTIKEYREVSITSLVERLVRTVTQATNLRLIILDPVARFRGGEENLAEDTTRFVEAVEVLAKRTGAAVLVLHHANKASMQGNEQTQAAARGSSALTDGVRLQINLSLPTRNDGELLGADQAGGLIATITKSNYSRAGVPIFLRRDEDGILVPIDLDAARAAKDRDVVGEIVALVRAEGAAGRTYSKASFATEYGGREGQFRVGQDALKGLVDRAVQSGALEVLPGKAKKLQAREAPVPIQKAKVDLP